jgi:hypothetical protein
MTATTLVLTGHLRQSDTETLRRQAMACIEAGALVLAADGLESIEVGPLQVLLCAASQARQLGLPCKLESDGRPAVENCLAAVRLPAAATFFTLIPTTEKPVQQ